VLMILCCYYYFCELCYKVIKNCVLMRQNVFDISAADPQLQHSVFSFVPFHHYTIGYLLPKVILYVTVCYQRYRCYFGNRDLKNASSKLGRERSGKAISTT
jgi:hypothetical protein